MIPIPRVLLPSWRFFDRSGESAVEAPQLWIRVTETEWMPALEPKKRGRSIGALFFNARENLNLALQSLVDRMAGELDPHSVTYDLLLNWATECARDRGLGFVQFKITCGGEVILISPTVKHGN